MFCRYCGNQISELASVCPSCGGAVVKDNTVNINPELSYSYQPEITPQNWLPMKWFKFLIYFQLWASAVLNVLSGIMMMRGTVYGADVDTVYSMFGSLKVIDVLFGVLQIVFAVYLIYVRFQLAGFKKNAPTLLLFGYAASLAASLLYALLVFFVLARYGAGLLDVIDPSIIGTIVGTVILILLSKTYFDRRKHMFVN